MVHVSVNVEHFPFFLYVAFQPKGEDDIGIRVRVRVQKSKVRDSITSLSLPMYS